MTRRPSVVLLAVVAAVGALAAPAAASSRAPASSAVSTSGPLITWTSPSAGVLARAAEVPLVLQARVAPDSDATLDRVEVFLDGEPLFAGLDSLTANEEWEPRGGTYRETWSPGGLEGTHDLVAEAYDSDGTVSRATRTVTFPERSCPEDPRRCPAPSLSLTPSTITAGQSASVVVRGVDGGVVELLGYSRPSTTYRVLRTARVAGGVARFSVAPLTNTRLFARYQGATAASPAPALSVRPKVVGYGVEDEIEGLDYLGGSLRPAAVRPVTVYRVLGDGRKVAMFRTTAGVHQGGSWFGEYYGFTKAGTYTFVARTSADALNAAGESAPFRYRVQWTVKPQYAGVIRLGL